MYSEIYLVYLIYLEFFWQASSTTWFSHILEWAGVDTRNMTVENIHDNGRSQEGSGHPTLEEYEELKEKGPFIFNIYRHPFSRYYD